MMFLKHVLMSEEIAAEGVSGGGGMDAAVEADQGTEATPSPDYSDLLEDYKKLSSGEEPAKKGGDDKQPVARPEEEVADDETPDDHSGAKDDGGDGGAPVEDDSSAFDDDLVDRARMLGLSDEQIESFDSNVHLERTLAVLGTRLLNDPGQGKPPEETAAREPEPAQKQTTPKEPGERSTWRDELRDEKEFDPVWGQVVSDFEKLEARIQEMEQRHVQRESELVTQAFDEAVNSLDGPFASIYGKSGDGKLGAKELEARQKLFEKAVAFGGVDGLRNKSLLKQVAVALNTDEYEKHLTRETSGAVRRNGKRRLRPAGSASTTKKIDAPDRRADGTSPELLDLYAKMHESQ